MYSNRYMKLKFAYFIFFLVSLSVNAQIDSQKKSTVIPAIESKKDSSESPLLLPLKTNEDKAFNGLSIPNNNSNINTPNKDFSMFGETFGNPGELYDKKVNQNLASTKLTPKEVEQINGSTTDQYFGDFKSNATFVNVVYRDFGEVDGDLIQVRLNDDVIVSSVFLTGGFKGLKLKLQTGLNKIDFVALNQGESGPNTAEFQVVDDMGNLISANRWNLATGVKATIIVVKE